MITLAVLLVGGGGGGGPPPPEAVLPPPPPPATAARHRTAPSPILSARIETISANLPCRRRWGWRFAGRPSRTGRACGRRSARRDRPAESARDGDRRIWNGAPRR